MGKSLFSENILKLRKSNHYTQKKVAEFLNISTRRYGYMEKGNFTCEYIHIIKLCKLYNVTSDELFGITQKIIFPENI